MFAEFAYNNSIHAIIGVILLMAAEDRHVQIETAAPKLSSKLDGVGNPAAQHWVEKLLAIWREMTNRWMKAAATQRIYTDKWM